MKKGQITVFIAIGILIMFSMFLSFAFSERERGGIVSHDQVNLAASAARSYIRSCVADAAEESIRQAGLKGGYDAPLQAGAVMYQNAMVPLYLDGSNLSVPPLDEVEEQTGRAIIKKASLCVSPETVGPMGFGIVEKSSGAYARLHSGNTTTVIAALPFALKHEGAIFEIGEIYADVPIRLSYAHRTAERFAEEIHERWQEGKAFSLENISCSDIGRKVRVHSHEALGGARVIQIIDYDVPYASMPFIYQFAVRDHPLRFMGDSCS